MQRPWDGIYPERRRNSKEGPVTRGEAAKKETNSSWGQRNNGPWAWVIRTFLIIVRILTFTLRKMGCIRRALQSRIMMRIFTELQELLLWIDWRWVETKTGTNAIVPWNITEIWLRVVTVEVVRSPKTSEGRARGICRWARVHSLSACAPVRTPPSPLVISHRQSLPSCLHNPFRSNSASQRWCATLQESPRMRETAWESCSECPRADICSPRENDDEERWGKRSHAGQTDLTGSGPAGGRPGWPDVTWGMVKDEESDWVTRVTRYGGWVRDSG